jgi:hypothetical protein
MITIQKYMLETPRATLQLPEGATPFRVTRDFGKINLWVEATPSAPPVDAHFILLTDGSMQQWDLEDYPSRIYIGSFNNPERKNSTHVYSVAEAPS